MALVAADLDRDGREDFAVMNFGGGDVSVLRNVVLSVAARRRRRSSRYQTRLDTDGEALEENEPTNLAILDTSW